MRRTAWAMSQRPPNATARTRVILVLPAVFASASSMRLRKIVESCRRSPTKISRTPLACRRIDFALQNLDKQAHQRIDLLRGSIPVFTAEREQCQHLHAGSGTGLDNRARRPDSGPMTRKPGPAMVGRPAPVTIHDDGHMTRQSLLRDSDFQTHKYARRLRMIQKSMISFCFSSESLSISATWRSVRTCISWLPRRSSSSVISFSLSSSLRS